MYYLPRAGRCMQIKLPLQQHTPAAATSCTRPASLPAPTPALARISASGLVGVRILPGPSVQTEPRQPRPFSSSRSSLMRLRPRGRSAASADSPSTAEDSEETELNDAPVVASSSSSGPASGDPSAASGALGGRGDAPGNESLPGDEYFADDARPIVRKMCGSKRVGVSFPSPGPSSRV